ncbi:tRNA lysidine(34) synthetase TilS [candidate division LCP-89 bacterium B3_LCP]|uniref:tRNA(Ile)-lysidine synthase n=1 Tax=candidate division LCP-89 bacterium B3_LCP TaxID=2012998 RepID=A0A532UY71_UNCL8|nr:MAG: tRNA lysidine(34) synthetase TilS [candidate division LCP-89 bacterium B3_LCP]
MSINTENINLPKILFDRLVELTGVSAGNPVVLVAVSGGSDSMALLDSANELSGQGRIKLKAAHLIHHPDLREARHRANLVEEYCAQRGIHLSIESLSDNSERELSPEERMRKARYKFLESTAEEQNCDFILTGHHADDQAETVLMRIISGTGIKGLSGIPARRGKVIRPFLILKKEDLTNYVHSKQIPYSQDPTNVKLNRPRNYLRHKLLPSIKDDLNPAIEQALIRLGERATEAYEIIDKLTLQCWDESLVIFQKNKIILDITTILTYFTTIRKYVVIKAVSELLGKDFNVTSDDLDAIARFIDQSKTGKFLELTGDVRLLRDRQSLIISSESSEPFQRELVPGVESEIPEMGARITWGKPIPEQLTSGDGYVADIDLGTECKDLAIRYAREGDRFHPLGASGSKRLFRFLADRRVPRFEKLTTPVIVKDETVIWVIGHRISEAVRVNSLGEHTWRVQIIPD